MFEVQQGVPLPKIDHRPKNPARKHPLATMAVGDMYCVPDRTPKKVSAYIARISKGLPGKFTARHTWMRPGGEGEPEWVVCDETHTEAREGTGVWRLE